MNKLKLYFIIFTITLTFNSCKLIRLGILELKSKFNDSFLAILVDDDIYESEVEFEYTNDEIEFTGTGYYWPDRSARDLGYNYKCNDPDGKYFTADDECVSSNPGKNGHWSNLLNNNSGGSGGTSDVWQRYDSPKGYQTDIAVGNIPGEPSNRVYMCEHPGSPSAGLYKGYISGNTITFDANHGLPKAEFRVVGNERRFIFLGVANEEAKYKKGIWTNTCGELKYSAKNIYYRWTTGSDCPFPAGYSMTFKYPDLPSSLTKNQQYGPVAAGVIEVDLNSSSGKTYYGVTLTEPPKGYRRIYTHNLYKFNINVNRCNFFIDNSSLTYVDQPL